MEQLRLTLTKDGAVRVEVQAKPRARTSRVREERAGALVVELAAPPVDGAANAELVATIAAALGLPRRAVSLVRGESSRSKLVEVRGLGLADVRSRLAAAAGG